METFKIRIGEKRTEDDGNMWSTLRSVQFTGEQLAREADFEGPYNHEIKMLYRANDGRLIVHTETVYGGDEDYTLQEVRQDDLTTLYPGLAGEAGLDIPLTLDEALAKAKEE